MHLSNVDRTVPLIPATSPVVHEVRERARVIAFATVH